MILDGKVVAKNVEETVKMRMEEFNKKYSIKPVFKTLLVGNDPASEIYARSKIKNMRKFGIDAEIIQMDSNISTEDLISKIDELNVDKNVHSIMVEMPLPKHIDRERVIRKIDPVKDTDGQNPFNLGLLLSGDESHVPSTPMAVIKMLEYHKIELKGTDVCIINRTQVVGKPLAMLFLNRDSTVTVCHSKTKDLNEKTLKSDIIVVAVGKPKFLIDNMVRENSTVIDVGINSIDNKIVGDADFESISKKASISPVPGGVGAVTTMLITLQVIENAFREIQ
ncbi:MAG: bifunctional 5,10-methylenetetrahydrofolate dehydrogenase/5,10-methenyltetrahydrofolate cyclohydrolase [Thermoplasmata archaeon]